MGHKHGYDKGSVKFEQEITPEAPDIAKVKS
jgi:hypothetical protein